MREWEFVTYVELNRAVHVQPKFLFITVLSEIRCVLQGKSNQLQISCPHTLATFLDLLPKRDPSLNSWREHLQNIVSLGCGFKSFFRRLFMSDVVKTLWCLMSFPHSSVSVWPPLWSSGQSFWLQIQRSWVRFPALLDFLSSSGSGTGSTQPCEVNWGATWIKRSGSDPENRD